MSDMDPRNNLIEKIQAQGFHLYEDRSPSFPRRTFSLAIPTTDRRLCCFPRATRQKAKAPRFSYNAEVGTRNKPILAGRT